MPVAVLAGNEEEAVRIMRVLTTAMATASMRVTEADLASSIGFDEADVFPPIFATQRLVALMEVAAARVLREASDTGELSVGVAIDIVHTAATPIGSVVTATARFMEMQGKLFCFEVSAYDEGGEIGRGTHRRAVVKGSRLVAGATKRVAGVPS
jgi:fluoroacetyl-CoA thioesterase